MCQFNICKDKSLSSPDTHTHIQGHDMTFTDDKVCKRFYNPDLKGKRSECVQGYRDHAEQGRDI